MQSHTIISLIDGRAGQNILFLENILGDKSREALVKKNSFLVIANDSLL